MKVQQIEVETTDGFKPAKIYLPFADAEFAAQKALKPSGLTDWHVVHVRTTFIVPRTESWTRDDALTLAEKLCEGCPSAALITRGEGGPKEKRYGPVSGPIEKLRAEALAVLS